MTRTTTEHIELIRKKADECGLFDRAFTTSEVAYLLAEIDALRIDCKALADALRGGGFGVRWTSGDDPEAVKAAIARHGGGA